MNAHQMVCHLRDSFQGVSGERFISPKMNWFSRNVIKWVALRTQMPWPKGIATRPEVDQHQLGTPPGHWGDDVAGLVARLGAFPGQLKFGSHPMFGPMELEEWRIWGWRHCDHHLRQFGV